MAARGRGRGRGQPVSFNIEQLGIGRGADAIPTGQTHPPPLFPPLENRPLPISRNTVEEEYILVVQKDFITRRSTSPFFLKPNGAMKRDNQQFPVGLSVPSDNRELPVLWNRMPSILREKTGRVKRSASSTTGPKGKLRKLDPLKLLERLEDKEKEVGDEDVEEDKKDGDSEDERELENQEIDEEEEDEEMDEGTDYANGYFDNGEAYADEDNPQDENESTFY